ncbi:discoidin domain-containing protein [Parapedobacter tibetensis]|uniref:discoidin domain-containing protein n=1 Tax=Parapedobacter tibetensis TaxID=2972951 RepID=UPI00214D1B92|nr:discoidin domain-containing protein [Parapedobacter tibetensis]
MSRALICFFVLLAAGGCRPYPRNVERALALTGANRAELETVLDHYRHRDKRKFEAACFLIANMPYHGSGQSVLIPDGYDHFVSRTDSLYRELFGGMNIRTILKAKPKGYDSVRRELAVEFGQLDPPRHKENGRADIEVVEAPFLINNIDQAFAVWQESPFLQGMDFETFREFVLPYRSTNEELIFNRGNLRQQWASKIHKPDDIGLNDVLLRYQAYVTKSRWINHFTKPKAKSAVYDLLLPKFKMDCHNMTNWSIRILRACGIPVVYEYTLQWKDRPSRHFWCVSPDSNGIWQPYTSPDNALREDWESDIQYAGKVYRRQFAANPRTPYFLAGEDEYIPEELSSPLLSDQTHRYHQTVTLKLPFRGETGNHLAYLCMLTREGLNPVAWGRIERKRRQAVFEQVPLFTVFVLAYMDENEEIVPIGPPFMLDADGVPGDIPLPLTHNRAADEKVLELDGDTLFERSFWRKKKAPVRYVSYYPRDEQSVAFMISRKYPEKRRLKAMREKLIGGFFTGSQEEKSGYDTLAVLSRPPAPYLQEIELDNDSTYRYYRFWTADRGPVNIAHMEFLGPGQPGFSARPATDLPIFYPPDGRGGEPALVRIDGTPLPTGSNPEHAFDGVVDTYVGASGTGMDFGRPVKITHVRFVPRTANNGIVPGNEYRLWYHDGLNWQEHSRQTASYHYLQFNNVPAGTLYRLQNLGEGNEELPFTQPNGEQQFINLHNPLYQ